VRQAKAEQPSSNLPHGSDPPNPYEDSPEGREDLFSSPNLVPSETGQTATPQTPAWQPAAEPSLLKMSISTLLAPGATVQSTTMVEHGDLPPLPLSPSSSSVSAVSISKLVNNESSDCSLLEDFFTTGDGVGPGPAGSPHSKDGDNEVQGPASHFLPSWSSLLKRCYSVLYARMHASL